MPQIGEVKTGKEIGKGRRGGKYIWLACEICGKQRWTTYYKKVKRCNHCTNFGRVMPRGDKARHWKGGYINQGGYHLIKVPQEDFFFPMTDYRGYIMEHRLIMAKQLKRHLLPWEVVHHKNGIKTDNRIGNLSLLPSQTKHLVSMKAIQEINRLKRKIIVLQKENVLLKRRINERAIKFGRA